MSDGGDLWRRRCAAGERRRTITDFVTDAFTFTLNVNHTDGRAVDSGTVTVRILGASDPPV